MNRINKEKKNELVCLLNKFVKKFCFFLKKKCVNSICLKYPFVMGLLSII